MHETKNTIMSIDTITIVTATTESTTKAANQRHTPRRLPPELWLIIFRFATSSPISYPPPPSDDAESTSTTTASYRYYEPFQTCHHETTIALSDAAVRDRCAITLVCRQWRALAGHMRYEDIRIGRGIAALQAALSEPAARNTDTTSSPLPLPSRYRVRRAVLPYAHTATPTYHTPPALALLALLPLPHLEVLVRPPLSPPISSPPLRPPPSHHRTLIPITTRTRTIHSLPTTSPRFEFPIAAPALPALRRLEWAFDKTGAATRAGGINSLTDMLKATAPSLSELVLTGPMPHAALRQDRVTLPALRTLRFRTGACGCPFLSLQTSYWTMPALENVVVEGGGRATSFEALWEKVGGLVRVVQLELGGMSTHDVRKIVNACPELEELNFRIGCGFLNWWNPMDDPFFYAYVVARGHVHDTLQRLGICVDVDVDLDAQDHEWPVNTWIALAEFVGDWKSCPALRQVVLYVRDVQVAERNPQFHLFHGELASSGRELLLRSVRI